MSRMRSILALTACLAVVSGAAWGGYNPGDAWLVDQGGQIIRVTAENKIDPQVISGFKQPVVAAVNPSDGSLWVADSAAQVLVKFGADKTQKAMIKGIVTPSSISLNPVDGSVWVGMENGVAKFDASGKQIFKIGGIREAYVAVNPNDGTCWVTDAGRSGNPPGKVLKLGPDGSQLLVIDKGFTEPKGVAVYPKDGSAWVVDSQGNKVVKLDANGNTVVTLDNLNFPTCVAVNWKDGTAWISTQDGRLLKVSPDGKVIKEIQCQTIGIMFPLFVAVDSYTGSVWVIDTIMRQVIKLDENGTPKIQIPRQILQRPSYVAVAPYWRVKR
ncbi:hypothetical protein DRP77_05735 [Candidatus Poribacteria bacterium]|nr:MAG: hypothetical protein DRP77_05735 [Candidatus Poribacteria bacterium]